MMSWRVSLLNWIQIALWSSGRLKKRKNGLIDYLLDKHKYEDITREEKEKLDHFLVLDRLVRMAKIRADKAKANE